MSLAHEKAFETFHRLNPQVYKMFKRFAAEAYKAGARRISSKLIIERIRWEVAITTKGSIFKINNNFTPYYARLFMKDFPGTITFETRILH